MFTFCICKCIKKNTAVGGIVVILLPFTISSKQSNRRRYKSLIVFQAGNVITSKINLSIFSTRESTWNYMMTNFHHNTYITIRFAKLVPGKQSIH